MKIWPLIYNKYEEKFTLNQIMKKKINSSKFFNM